MANFDDQVRGLTNITISSSGTNPTEAELTTFLTDGAKELINLFPKNLKEKCVSITVLNDSSTTYDMDAGGEVLHVTRLSADSSGYQIPCRKIPSMYGDRSNDSTDLNFYATATDPVYWVSSNSSGVSTLFVKPLTTSAQTANVYRIAYPAVAYSDSVIANFPNEAEYLVSLYASCKSLQNAMGALQTNSDIATALTAVNTELDETQVICDLINTQVDDAVVQLLEAATQVDASIDTALAAIVTAAGRVNTAVGLANDEFDKCDTMLDLGEADTESTINTAIGLLKTAVDQAATACDKFESADESIFGDEETFKTTESQLTEVQTALVNVKTMFNTDLTDDDGAPASESVLYWLADEDPEMVSATISAMGVEIQRAQANLSQWSSIGDMRVKEIQASLSEADGYSKEIQARLSQASSKREESNSRIALGNAYLSEANANAKEAQTFVSEVQARISQVGGYGQVASGYMNAAQGYANELQSKVSIAQGYIAELDARMKRDSQKYQWYQSQHVSLKQDYQQGIMVLTGQGVAPQQAGGK
jgi:hypothetical protein